VADRLTEIRSRLERATPGPWSHDTGKYDEHDTSSPDLVCAAPRWDNVARCYQDDLDEGAPPGQDHRNAAFIAHAPEDIAWLLDQVAELERKVAAIRRGEPSRIDITGWPLDRTIGAHSHYEADGSDEPEPLQGTTEAP
jgi:hypothetical protein